MRFRPMITALAVMASTPVAANAQSPFELPRVSQLASVTQRVGLTDITISYHRPGVNGRTIWGELVPYDQVWRAGANQNTTITFSTPVTIGDIQLAAGTYGLHMLPARLQWTVILSHQAHAWGSFSYDEAEDAVRVKARPTSLPFQERLSYTFDDPTQNSVFASMNWEKLRVSFEIDVATNDVVVGYLQDQLRGLPRFSWNGWYQAANWCYTNDTHLEQAVQWTEQSLARNENFSNLTLKANLLDKMGETQGVGELRERAMSLAGEGELNNYGYQLMGQGKMVEALQIFRKNVEDHPDSWNVYDSLADCYETMGDRDNALKNYRTAHSLVSVDSQKQRIEAAIARLGG